MQGDDLPDVVLLAIVAFVILFIGVSALSTTAEVTLDDTGTASERVQTAQELDGSGSWYRLGENTGINETLYNSRGYAVNLTGADDSYVQSDSNIQVGSDENWTVTTWAYVDSDATGNMTVLGLNGRVILGYNATVSNWTLWYYDDGSRNSYELELNAPNQPANFTHLAAVGNESHIRFYRNNSQSAIQNVSQNSVVDAPVNSSNFNGRLEETRTFDDPLNDTERQALVDSPLGPQPGWNRTARIMYDEPYASQQLILFSSADLTTSNVTYSSGFDGYELDDANYTWNEDGPRVKVDTATELPVVYIDYTEQIVGIGSLVGPVAAAFILAGLLPVLVVVGYVLTQMSGVGESR